MLNALKNHILKRYMDLRLRWFKGPEEPIQFAQALAQVRHILLIAPVAEPNLQDAVLEFASKLYDIFRNVRVSTFERSTFRPADGNWFGLPREDYLDNFRQEKIDLVIDLNLRADRFCTYITALCGAQLRLNIATDKYDHIYNLHIRTNDKMTSQTRYMRILEHLKTLNPDAN